MLAGGAATDYDHIVFIHCGLSSPACSATIFTFTVGAFFCKHNAAAHLCATFMRAIPVRIAAMIFNSADNGGAGSRLQPCVRFGHCCLARFPIGDSGPFSSPPSHWSIFVTTSPHLCSAAKYFGANYGELSAVFADQGCVPNR
jgi:hypothetical protein